MTFDPKAVYDFELEKTLDEKVLLKKCWQGTCKGEQSRSFDVEVTNTDRTFGTILGVRDHKTVSGNGLAGRHDCD